MSKQFLTTHVTEEGQPISLLDPASHAYDIYGLAVTSSHLLTVSGDSSVKVWDITSPKHSLVHQFSGAHKLGGHHIAAGSAGQIAASVGFGGEILIWDLEQLKQKAKIEDCEGVWAVGLSPKGDQLACTTCDGKISIWDTSESKSRLKEYSTKGSYGTCIDISPDGNLVASGHENGGIYIFNNTTTRMHHSLQGLVKPVRAVKFSPGGKLLAACGDSNLIALFDVASGEQVANLAGHSSWVFSVAWSSTGEYIISGSFDGKVKVWSVDTLSCVATQNEATGAVYSVSCIPKVAGVGGEGFVSAGAGRNLNFYRETTGGE